MLYRLPFFEEVDTFLVYCSCKQEICQRLQKKSWEYNIFVLPKYSFTKAELLQVGIFFLIHLFAWEILLLKKLEIEGTKTT